MSFKENAIGALVAVSRPSDGQVVFLILLIRCALSTASPRLHATAHDNEYTDEFLVALRRGSVDSFNLSRKGLMQIASFVLSAVTPST